MDILLSKVTQQAMNYAIRSGITITSGYAISQCSRLLKTKAGSERDELATLQRRLDSKIRIVSPAIDMIELITARGNTSLESAVSLTKDIRWDIQALGMRLAKAAADEELSRKGSSKAKTKAQNAQELKHIVSDMRNLLNRIEDAVPLINLAITTSGVSLSTNLPASVSPSRLLQASTFLTAGDAQYAADPSQSMQVGPAFTLSMYMLFAGHANRAHDEDGLRNTTWQEVIHKARVKLLRTPLNNVSDLPGAASHETHSPVLPGSGGGLSAQSIPGAARVDEYAYKLQLVEDLDDDRVHTFDDEDTQPTAFDDVTTAGIREVFPIHQVAKIFYADTGKILNIGSDGETNSPILLLKRDVNSAPPRRMVEREPNAWEHAEEFEDPPSHGDDFQVVDEDSEIHAQFARESTPQVDEEGKPAKHEESWRLPRGLDPEWIAFEVFVEDPDSDDGADEAFDVPSLPPSRPSRTSRQSSLDPSFTSALSDLRLTPSSATTLSESHTSRPIIPTPYYAPATRSAPLAFGVGAPIRTSLSLLEMLIRLTSLQQFQQASHLTITDELLHFFLEESSTTGAAPGDIEARKRIRREALQHVGFDPYDESPVKRRGEEYQYRQSENAYEREYGEEWSDLPDVRRSKEQTPNAGDSSPLLLRERPHFSLPSGTATPNRSTPHWSSSPSRQTSPLPGKKHANSVLATPPVTTKARHNFLRHEHARSAPVSPLARSMSASSATMERSDGASPSHD